MASSSSSSHVVGGGEGEDASSTCPLCNVSVTQLQQHLDAHSKDDLIRLLIQKTALSTLSPSSSPSPTPRNPDIIPTEEKGNNNEEHPPCQGVVTITTTPNPNPSPKKSSSSKAEPFVENNDNSLLDDEDEEEEDYHKHGPGPSSTSAAVAVTLSPRTHRKSIRGLGSSQLTALNNINIQEFRHVPTSTSTGGNSSTTTTNATTRLSSSQPDTDLDVEIIGVGEDPLSITSYSASSATFFPTPSTSTTATVADVDDRMQVDEEMQVIPKCQSSSRSKDAGTTAAVHSHHHDEDCGDRDFFENSVSTVPSSSSECESQSQSQSVGLGGMLGQESDNATSQTSIIKFIIDQGAKRNQQLQRIKHEASHSVPVYSAFNQVHEVSPRDQQQINNAAATDNARSMGHGHGHHHHHHHHHHCHHHNQHDMSNSQLITGDLNLNLMTDEEIPPRGEISEFEESNTSSFVSEDSLNKIQPPGTIIGPHQAAITAEAASDVKNSPSSSSSAPKTGKKRDKHSPPKGKRANKKEGDRFFCHECPSAKEFKSLFELIGHKVKVHPSATTEGFEHLEHNTSTASIPPLFDSSSPIGAEDKKELDGKAEILASIAAASSTAAAPPKDYFCLYCTNVFNTRNALTQHVKEDHKDKPEKPEIFECSYCGKTFPGRPNLRKHLLVHREKKYKCPTCSKSFISNFKLNEHARLHTKSYPFECQHCSKAYRTPSLLNQHTKNAHLPLSERPVRPRQEFYCGVCQKTLHSKRCFVAHWKNHNDPTHSAPQKCPQCSEMFTRRSLLIRHVRATHDSQFGTVLTESKECPVCHKRYHPNSMIKHMRIHTDVKPFSCQVCAKNFRTQANLSAHAWNHTNVERPFKCTQCPKSYIFKRTLEHHMMTHKRRTLHYVCNECGVRFTNKVNMKRHREEHYSEKKHKCKTCGKAFQRRYYLVEHQRIHSGVKPFVCNICGKASATKSNHRAHIKIHDARDGGSQEG